MLNNRIHILLVTEAMFNLLFFFTITMFCLFNSVSWAYMYWIFVSLCPSPVIWNTSNYCCFKSILHWTASLWSHWVITETLADLNGSRTKPVKHSLNSCTNRVFTNSNGSAKSIVSFSWTGIHSTKIVMLILQISSSHIQKTHPEGLNCAWSLNCFPHLQEYRVTLHQCLCLVDKILLDHQQETNSFIKWIFARSHEHK